VSNKQIRNPNSKLQDAPRASVTDSVWFWLLIFSAMGAIGLTAVQRKFDVRQSEIERQGQARGRARSPDEPTASSSTELGKEHESDASRVYSTPGNTVLRLLPVQLLALAIAVVSAVMLVREYRRDDPSDKGESTQ